MHFENVVFCGGGNRCFWQAGFWSALAPILYRQPSGVVAVSAGAAMACALLAGTFDGGFDAHKRAVRTNLRNVHIRNLLKGTTVFPHGGMYRAAILASIDAAALSRLHDGPELHIVLSHPPPWAGPRLAMLMAAFSLGVDAWNSNDVNAAAARRVGFKPLLVPVRECSTPEELADIIVASSCVPPLTPQAHRCGVAVLDGGLVSNVPTDMTRNQGGQTLVMLTRRFKRLPSLPGHVFVQPSAPIAVSTWDYTNEGLLQAAFDLGRRDGADYANAQLARAQSIAAPLHYRPGTLE